MSNHNETIPFDLVAFLKKSSKKKINFPFDGKINYYESYNKIKEYLDINVHPILVTVASKKDGGFLTDHGTDHINKVIDRVSSLINNSIIKLTPYECYLLLIAIQLHDTGHLIDGRSKHEESVARIIEMLGKLIGEATPEKTIIYRICAAHGGDDENGEKADKLGSNDLFQNDFILGFAIRPKLLAALLRFGDELAEDSTRANRFLLNEGKIIEGSQIFHAYSDSLHTVNIDIIGKQVNLIFNLKKEYVINKLRKLKSEEFLLDEIFKRIYKTYVECIYCMRFLPSGNKIETIYARIDFLDDEALQPYFESISVKLSEKGYPKLHAKNIYEICKDDLKYKGNGFITGELVNKIVSKG